MAAVMIGVDPHKGSHTAVAVSPAEEPLGEVRVRASVAQAERLLAWAVAWPERHPRSRVRAGWGTCWPSSCWPRVSGCWMCSPSWARGNRRLNHVIHMAAVTQIRYRHSDGRAYYDRKLAEGKTPKEALRALKRRVSDAIYARLQADARRAAAGPR